MKIFIGSDHAGFEYKQQIIKFLEHKQFNVSDCGTNSIESCDYPDYAHKVARSIIDNKNAMGILICGSANGVCMTANKHKGIRAAIIWDNEISILSRQHNDANIICLPARFISLDKAKECIELFLSTTFEGGRHLNRINKMDV